MEIFINAVFIIIISILVLVMTIMGFYAGLGILLEIVNSVDDLIIKIKNKHKKIQKNERIKNTL